MGKQSKTPAGMYVLIGIMLALIVSGLLVYAHLYAKQYADNDISNAGGAMEAVPAETGAANANTGAPEPEQPSTGSVGVPDTSQTPPAADDPPAVADKTTAEPPKPQRDVEPGHSAGKIVLILDDAGLDIDVQWQFLALPARLVFAVLPDCRYTTLFAQKAIAAGHEVMLHAPMLPLHPERHSLPGRLLRPGMAADDVFAMLHDFFGQIPGAAGMNNHMGSAATADHYLMQHVMEFLGQRRLFFVDSVTHSSTVAYAMAGQYRVPALKRDVFLDNRHEYIYIKAQLEKLAALAGQRGFAVGIGHVTVRETWAVLRDMIPELQQRGFEFVSVTEML